MCHAVSIEEEDTSHRYVIVADAGYGPAGLGDAHIGFRDLRGRDGWPGRLPSAGRIGLQPEWLSAASEQICSGRLSPERTGTALAGSTGCSSAGRRPLRGRWQPGGGFPGQSSSRSSYCGSTSWHVTPAPMLPRMAPGPARPVVTASTIPMPTSKEPQAKRHAQRDLPSAHVSSGMPLHVHMLQRV